jgi:predicted unusual protein kinase regulating ubiquinone biosynthesis (AarF/ABC1/UbiB family)
MCAMAVEAVTAGLVLTGIVHADPHEGNMMLADDGRLVFLDFGLMSTVEADIMEAFALGA